MNQSLPEKFSLSGRIAVVTGGCGHLGRNMVASLKEAGASVIVCDLKEDAFRERIGEPGIDGVFFMLMDISSTDSIKNAFREIFNEHGRIDILVNNAFYSAGQSPEEMTDSDWTRGLDGTLSSVYRCIREVVPYMKEQSNGTIINIASMYGIVSPDFSIYSEHGKFLNPPHYGAAKAGVIQLTKYFAAYLMKYNIRVNCISPGPFPSLEVQKEAGFIEKLSAKTPMKRIGVPGDLEGPILFLASEASSYVNGHNLVVDGGWTIW